MSGSSYGAPGMETHLAKLAGTVPTQWSRGAGTAVPLGLEGETTTPVGHWKMGHRAKQDYSGILKSCVIYLA